MQSPRSRSSSRRAGPSTQIERAGVRKSQRLFSASRATSSGSEASEGRRQPSGVSDQLAKASITEELRDVTLRAIQEVVSAHQDLRRIEEE
jgi:hypothetical protein